MALRFLYSCVINSAMALACFGQDLAGKVVDKDGRPIANASIFVLAAQPRTGWVKTCPSCYEDCGRKAKTDASGEFVLLELDLSLRFLVAAAAEGRRAEVVEAFDPNSGPVNFVLQPLSMEGPPESRVRGRVVDEQGQPVAGALVEVVGRARGSSRRSFGDPRQYGTDRFAVTNPDGEFLITGTEPAEAFFLRVSGHQFAARRFSMVPTGDDADKNKLVIDQGVSVRGRVVKDGQPVADVAVGLTGVARPPNTVGRFQATAGRDGRFEFLHLPRADFYLYTFIASTKAAGALPLDFLPLTKSGVVLDLGDLPLGPSHAISGRVIPTDQPGFPGNVQLSLLRDVAAEVRVVEVGVDGRFRFDNVPHDETVTLTLRFPGYRAASNRNRFQQVGTAAIALHVDGPREGIEIFFEPAPPAAR